MKTAEELLKEANEVIRSFASIAGRRGQSTNWDALQKRLDEVLDAQHFHIYGHLALDADQKADEEPRNKEARMRRIQDPQWYWDKSVTDALDARVENRNRKQETKRQVAAVDGGLTTDRNDPELRETKENGQHKKYIVLSEEERSKGFVRPYCDAYEHVGRKVTGTVTILSEEEQEKYRKYDYYAFEKYDGDSTVVAGRYITKADFDRKRVVDGVTYYGGCGATTTMSRAIAETYARDPKFYGATFCTTCGTHKPVGEHGEFIWERQFHNEEHRKVGV